MRIHLYVLICIYACVYLPMLIGGVCRGRGCVEGKHGPIDTPRSTFTALRAYNEMIELRNNITNDVNTCICIPICVYLYTCL
jgi:hypothetical protein